MHITIASLLAAALLCATGTAQERAAQSWPDTAEETDAGNDSQSSEAAAITPQPDLDFAPMTRSARLRDYLDGALGAHAFTNAVLRAEVGQLTGNPKEWGRGLRGFMKRAGSGFAQHFIRQTLRYAISSLLHEDNRYLRSGRAGFWKRSRYALASSFLARHDNGHRKVSISGIGSAAGASFISRAWLPRSVATAGAGASSFGITIGADIGANMLHEFWPDLKRHFQRH